MKKSKRQKKRKALPEKGKFFSKELFSNLTERPSKEIERKNSKNLNLSFSLSSVGEEEEEKRGSEAINKRQANANRLQEWFARTPRAASRRKNSKAEVLVSKSTEAPKRIKTGEAKESVGKKLWKRAFLKIRTILRFKTKDKGNISESDYSEEKDIATKRKHARRKRREKKHKETGKTECLNIKSNYRRVDHYGTHSDQK